MPEMNFSAQGFQKSEHYSLTDRCDSKHHHASFAGGKDKACIGIYDISHVDHGRSQNDPLAALITTFTAPPVHALSSNSAAYIQRRRQAAGGKTFHYRCDKVCQVLGTLVFIHHSAEYATLRVSVVLLQ